MRAAVMSLLLVFSTMSGALAWQQPEIEQGLPIDFRNGVVNSIPIELMPDDTYSGFWVLTHEYPVPTEWLGELEDSGIECWTFAPPSGFHCELSGQTTSQLESLDVEGMVQMPSYSKIHPDVMPSLEGKMKSYFIAPGIGVLNVVLSGEELPEDIHQRGDVEVLSHNLRWAKVEATTSGVKWLISQPEIEWVEPQFEFKISNNEAADIVSASVLWDATQMAGINQAWNALDGTGIIVAVADTGLDNGINNTNMHPDFRDHILGIHSYGISPDNQPFVNTPYNDGASDLDSGHGTHVAGSVLGDGTQSSGTIKGMAPEARLYMQAIEVYTDWTTSAENTYGVTDGYYLTGIPDDLTTLFDDAAYNNTNIHTNSWGSSVAGQYTTSSMQADYSARNHTEMLILFAASNDGEDTDNGGDGEVDLDSLGSPASAKNVLTVGASENDRSSITATYGGWWGSTYSKNPINSDKIANNSEGMAAFSSRGPALDDRIKPDVSAPGTFILSTKSRSTTDTGWGSYSNSDYTYMGGTSMATPITAGASALIYQHLIDNLGYSNPSSSLVKGIIAASAHDMAGQYGSSTNGAGEPAPNNHEGWGLLDLDRAVNSTWVDGDTVSTGDSRSWKFTVPSNAPDLRIMVSWTDPASSPSNLVHLVNDIDFAVKSPTGVWTEYGNDRDNLIGTTISSPASGQWEIHVNGSSIPTGPQAFSMVIDAPYSMINLSADADGDGFIDTLDDCPNTPGQSNQDQDGCPDGDGDGWSNTGDDFPNDSTQWSDTDTDGYGDNPGGNNPDSCVNSFGSSSLDRYGCLDSDSDGWSDPDGGWSTFQGADACSTTWGNSSRDRNGCLDDDGDGQSNINDILSNDPTQWLDSDGDGYYDNPNPATNWDDCPSVSGTSTVDLQGCVDTDSDGVSDQNDPWPNDPTRSIDTDSDGFADNEDDCPNFAGNSTEGLVGCLDADGDGRPAEFDAFPQDITQWNDTDGDGYGDNPAGNLADDCPNEAGNSWQNATLGCLDNDSDGWANHQDKFENDSTQWHDIDNDGYGDNPGGTTPDACPNTPGNSTGGGVYGCLDSDGDTWADIQDDLPDNPTQYLDSDGDGFGDNPNGTEADDCPITFGNSSIDRTGCVDTDGDGVSDLNDDFPDDPTRSLDSDTDGFDDSEDDCPNTAGTSLNGSIGCFDADQDTWADQNDSFPMNPTQWNDTDGDGYGDNINGTLADSCPSIFGNSSADRYGCLDSDGDAWSNVNDSFPSDGTEWIDSDMDGFGDNMDQCPVVAGSATDGMPGCPDSDGDGWSDNTDFMVNDSSQWQDTDGDGFGDNPDGFEGDDCPAAFGYSSIDKVGCEDDDYDGYSNEGDEFPELPTQHIDTDGDGYGDNNSVGAELPDHWPNDPERNVAEVLLSCTPDVFQIDVSKDDSLTFTCSITNLIQNNLSIKIDWKAMNSIEAGLRTQVLVVEGDGVKTVAFSGRIKETGDILSVIETREIGSSSSLAFVTLSIESINSTQGDFFSDADLAFVLEDHMQEIIAVGVCLLLIFGLGINSMRSSKKKSERRRQEMMQHRASSYSHEQNLFGRLPPRN